MSFAARERRKDISSRLLCPLLFRTCSARCAFRSPARSGFMLRASRREGNRESFCENLLKQIHFANFSDAPDARGHRELPVVKISALNDPWRYQKHKKNKKKLEFVTISEFSFSSSLLDFGGARLVLTSKSSSSKYFVSDGQILRSGRRFGRRS